MAVDALYIAARGGEPMTSCRTVSVSAGLGIEGDRYRERTGHWSDPRWPDQELTLIEAEVAESLDIDPGLLRRNVVTRGDRLADLIGHDIRIGEAVLRFVRPCDPCRYLEDLLARPGLRAALDERGGGVRAAVIQGGTITVGDALLALASF